MSAPESTQDVIDFRWVMPDSDRDFHVEVDEDGELWFRIGTVWTDRPAHHLSADEAKWVATVWTEIVAAVEKYSAQVPQ